MIVNQSIGTELKTEHPHKFFPPLFHFAKLAERLGEFSVPVLDAVGFHFGEGEDFFHFLKILCEFA
jgi:hypothetical protein